MFQTRIDFGVAEGRAVGDPPTAHALFQPGQIILVIRGQSIGVAMVGAR